jgi:hypothetical protein
MQKNPEYLTRNVVVPCACGKVKLVFVLVLLVLGGGFFAAGQVPAAKVYLVSNGFYRVTVSNLATVFNRSQQEMASASLRVENMGRPVSALRDQGDVVFYGHQFSSVYTDENVYWIAFGDPKSVEPIFVPPGKPPYAASYPVVKREERQLVARPDLFTDPSDTCRDPFLWRQFTSGTATRQYTASVNLPGLAPSSGGFLKVRMKGATEIAGRYYHAVSVELNGQLLGSMMFNGLEAKAATFPIPAGLFLSGNNNVKIVSTPPPGTSADMFYLDYIEAGYERTFAAQGSQLTAAVSTGASVNATGFTNGSVEVWEVQGRWPARRATGFQVSSEGSGFNVSFVPPTTGMYAAIHRGSEMSPRHIELSAAVNLRSTTWEVDHLILCSSSLRSGAEAIAAYRKSKGLASLVVTMDEVYDNFSGGIRDARSIESFLSYAYRNWKRSPRYVLLVGDGSFDHKNYLAQDDALLPAMTVVSRNGMYESDFTYGDIDADGLPEMAVGRIPATTTAHVTNYLTKMIRYEAGGSWRTNNLVVTDLPDYAGNYSAEGDALALFMGNQNIVKAHMDNLGLVPTREKFIAEANAGKDIIAYLGHGTPNQLSLSGMLVTSNVVSFTNYLRPAIYLKLGCLVGSFGSPGVTSLGEALVQAPGGAVAMLAAATLISLVDGMVFGEKFLEARYAEGAARLGDAWIIGKQQLTLNGRYMAYYAFQLLGDPALALGPANAPRGGVVPVPSRGAYEEWREWHHPSVLCDLGLELLPSEDTDGDALDNWSEYLGGTDPVDPDSNLAVVKLRPLPQGHVELTWDSTPGRTYQIERASLFMPGDYRVQQTAITSTPPRNVWIDTKPGESAFLYRVRVF